MIKYACVIGLFFAGAHFSPAFAINYDGGGCSGCGTNGAAYGSGAGYAGSTANTGVGGAADFSSYPYGGFPGTMNFVGGNIATGGVFSGFSGLTDVGCGCDATTGDPAPTGHYYPVAHPRKTDAFEAAFFPVAHPGGHDPAGHR